MTLAVMRTRLFERTLPLSPTSSNTIDGGFPATTVTVVSTKLLRLPLKTVMRNVYLPGARYVLGTRTLATAGSAARADAFVENRDVPTSMLPHTEPPASAQRQLNEQGFCAASSSDASSSTHSPWRTKSRSAANVCSAPPLMRATRSTLPTVRICDADADTLPCVTVSVATYVLPLLSVYFGITRLSCVSALAFRTTDGLSNVHAYFRDAVVLHGGTAMPYRVVADERKGIVVARPPEIETEGRACALFRSTADKASLHTPRKFFALTTMRYDEPAARFRMTARSVLPPAFRSETIADVSSTGSATTVQDQVTSRPPEPSTTL
eukprot:Opistho-2@21497